ncbi:OapC/ArvC family zinc-ribbon domain-containing protein [Halobacterium zhouii]|uniref:OapC/ArvC family zinc-ribbon domain-containing protein n=1 Tax=Halobacterium zhouii TaxID=2902624 RepID=UPI001E567813|nr:Zn-ribbon containing protein [Halobacterium zhouii]
MPHQCTNCGHVFNDGSKEMLSGCPDCGGNKFQYHPGEVPEEPGDTEPSEPPEPEGGSVSSAVGRAANRVRDAVTSDQTAVRGNSPPETEGVSGGAVSDSSPTAGDESASASSERSNASARSSGGADGEEPSASADQSDASGSLDAPESSGASEEDIAQASARSDVVDRNSLPDASQDGRVVKEPDDPEDRPDIDSLRAELNDQFESIRIVAPGQYELNLMELYDRQEYIIALQENGRYVIEVPDAWDAPEPGDE